MTNISNVENIVCACVNSSLGTNVIPEMIYKGKTKVKYNILLVRQFCCYVLHDMFHISYKQISAHTGISCRNVIKSAVNIRELTHINKDYYSILSCIKSHFEK